MGRLKKDSDVIVAPPHQILTKKMVLPPAIVSNRVLVSSRGYGERGVGLFKLRVL